MITIKNPDKEIKQGKVTMYEEVPDTILEDLYCPYCHKLMCFERDSRITGQGSSIDVMYFKCGDCQLLFKGYEDYCYFNDIEDFYNFVKERLENGKKTIS